MNTSTGTLRITSTSGRDPYRVRLVGGEPISCQCRGWQYRRTCRHADAARFAVQAGVVPTPDPALTVPADPFAGVA